MKKIKNVFYMVTFLVGIILRNCFSCSINITSCKLLRTLEIPKRQSNLKQHKRS